MKILILINGLRMGGAERMACFLSGEWVQAGHAVTIATLDGSHVPYFPLDPRVGLSHLGVSGPSLNICELVKNFCRRIGSVRLSIEATGSDVVIGFGGACLALASLAALGMSVCTIAYEQTDPLITEQKMGWLKRIVHRAALRLADAIVVQSSAAREVLPPTLRRRVHVIPNPIRPVTARATPAIPGSDGRFRLVSVGRLDAVKGFDVLLRAWGGIHAKLPNWILIIHGEGEERQALQSIIDKERLNGRAFLPGATREVEQRLAEANLFVLSSRTEGFPNALCEAMAVGLPVVSTDCRHGPSEIVTPGRDGLLVPVGDAVALGEAIFDLARDPARLAEMGEVANVIAQRFEKGGVMQMWDKLLRTLRRHQVH